MGEMPLVSVVVPAYNPGAYLREAIESLEQQTYSRWECIVVDDGSTEDLKWVDSIDLRVRRVRQRNRGLPAARNTGIENANGSYVAFLDADDIWMPRKLQVQLDILRAGASFTATNFYRFSSDSRMDGWPPDAADFQHLIRGNSICVSSVIVERDLLRAAGGFDERLRSAEDWDLWLRLIRVGRLVGTEEVLTGYRVHAGQMSGRPARMWFWSIVVILKQRSQVGASIQGVRRMGVIYGAQLFDRYRAGRNPLDLLAALVMSPRYILEEAFQFSARAIRRVASPRRTGVR